MSFNYPPTPGSMHIDTRPRRAAALLLALLATACSPDEPQDAETAPPAAATAAETPLPPGGLETWVSDVAVAADSVVTLAQADLKAAQERAMMLYIDRQEVIEQNYGPNGKLNAPQAVADAVMDSERRFHRVLALVNATDTTAIRAQIAGVVDSLKAQHAEVVRLAKEAGLPMDPRTAGAQ